MRKNYTGWLVACIILLNLVVMNDVITICPGVESQNIIQIQQGFSPDHLPFFLQLPQFIWSATYQAGSDIFLLRCLGCLFFLFSGWIWYLLGSRLFGRGVVLNTLLVGGSGLLLVNLSKFITTDLLLFLVQLVHFLSLILFLKQPVIKWKWLYWLSFLSGMLIHPFSMLVLGSGLWVYLYLLHPEGKRVGTLYTWILSIAGIMCFIIWGVPLSLPSYLLSFGNVSYLQFLGTALFGVLPWLGFLPSGLWEVGGKVRKKEEMALLLLGGLLFSFGAQSLLFHFFLCLLIGRQLINYPHKNYPYRNLVKTVSIIQIIFSLCAITFFLVLGYNEFGAAGFRAGMSAGIVYWIPAFVAVLSLFMNNLKYSRAGMAASGLLFTLFFWLQPYPLLEKERSGERMLAETVEDYFDKKSHPPRVFIHQSVSKNEVLEVYLNLIPVEIIPEGNPERLLSLARESKFPLIVHPSFRDQFGKEVVGVSMHSFTGRDCFYNNKKEILLLLPPE